MSCRKGCRSEHPKYVRNLPPREAREGRRALEHGNGTVFCLQPFSTGKEDVGVDPLPGIPRQLRSKPFLDPQGEQLEVPGVLPGGAVATDPLITLLALPIVFVGQEGTVPGLGLHQVDPWRPNEDVVELDELVRLRFQHGVVKNDPVVRQ